MTSASMPSVPGSPYPAAGDGRSTNLGDILERVLDKGIIIAGDIKVNLLDIELLTIKLRLLVASVDTARQLGIDWWEHDPWLTSGPTPVGRGADRTRVEPHRPESIEAGARTPSLRAEPDEDREYG